VGTNPRNIRTFWQKLTIWLFLALIWLPALDWAFKLDHARPPQEKRLPAAWPKFAGFDQTQKFVSGLESWFNDHFGFRNTLIHVGHQLKDKLFHDPTIGADVLVGKDGWLYLSSQEMIPHYLREMTFNDKDLEEWKNLLEHRRDWLQARGIKYLFVVAPDKQSVYPEYLPSWLPTPAKASKIQQLVSYMAEHSTVSVLNLGPALIDAKKARVDYYNTDTHWNLFGGYEGQLEVIRTLMRQLPWLQPLPDEEYNWKFTGKKHGGDLSVMSGVPEEYPEVEAVVPVPAQKGFIPLETNHLDEYALYAQRKMWTEYTVNTNATGTAIVFHDSFAEFWKQFLGRHFRKAFYVYQNQWDDSFIEKERPDVVIDEMVERSFNLAKPHELLKDKPVLH
jgi:hypothetical protein